MRSVLIGLLAVSCATVPRPGEEGTTAPDPAALKGAWKVDLRPTPDAPAYYQVFEVTALDDSGFSGTFYGTPFTDGRLNTAWGAVRFGFTTADQSGPYYHSGTLKDGQLTGMSYSTGRAFVAPWTAVRP